MNRTGVDIFAPYGFFAGSSPPLKSHIKGRFKEISRQNAADFPGLNIRGEMEVGL